MATGGGREDCWSEGATAALVEAWGDRYLRLNRGNLRQKDWSEVAGAVNARQDAVGRPTKTDVQCKNRVDTIKKKYKLELARPHPSSWPFFSHLHFLLGSNPPTSSSKKRPLHLTIKRRVPRPKPSPPSLSSSESSRGFHYRQEEEEEEEDEEEDDDEEAEEEEEEELKVEARKRRRRWEGLVECSGGDVDEEEEGVGVWGELARALERFGEVYERVENSKQRHMMEKERTRMEFAKELEFQRMQMFMETQIELEKMKRSKQGFGSRPGKRS